MDPIQPTSPSPHKPSMKDLESTGADQNGSPRLNLLRHDEDAPVPAPAPPPQPVMPAQPVQFPKPEPPKPIPAPAPAPNPLARPTLAPAALPIPKSAPPTLQQPMSPAKSGPKVPLIAGIVVLLLAGAGGGGWWYTQRSSATPIPQPQPKTAVADPQPTTPTPSASVDTPAPTPTPTPTPTPQTVATPSVAPSTGNPQTVTVQADHGLWLRSSPDSSNRSNIISWMPTNAQISVDQTGEFWWHGTYNGTPGYFASKYTK